MRLTMILGLAASFLPLLATAGPMPKADAAVLPAHTTPVGEGPVPDGKKLFKREIKDDICDRTTYAGMPCDLNPGDEDARICGRTNPRDILYCTGDRWALERRCRRGQYCSCKKRFYKGDIRCGGPATEVSDFFEHRMTKKDGKGWAKWHEQQEFDKSEDGKAAIEAAKWSARETRNNALSRAWKNAAPKHIRKIFRDQEMRFLEEELGDWAEQHS